MKKWTKKICLCLTCFEFIFFSKHVLADEKGFEQPEEVMAAYVEGFKMQDLEQMLSVFAIEKYVDHYQLEKAIEVKGYYARKDYFPNISDYTRELNIELRKERLYENIQNQYLVITESEAAFDLSSIRDYDNDPQKLLDDIFAEDDSVFLNSMELMGFMKIEESEIYARESVQKELEGLTLYIDAEEKVRPVTAWLRIAGVDYLMIMDTVCYDGLWYGLEPGGTFAHPSGMYYGVAAVDSLIGEKGMDLLYCSVIEPEGLTE